MLIFDQQGYLKPYEPIETDLETFEKTFAISSVRKAIFEQYLAYLSDLQEIIPNEFYQWIDGSFVTKKPLPFDLDVVTFVPFDIYIEKLERLKKVSKRYMQIDAYIMADYPKTHRRYLESSIDKIYWQDVYGKDRFGRKKGFILLNH
jgi:hypothetical protein